MKKKHAAKWRPFHETVLDAIRGATINDMACLARLIRATLVPKGHRWIIAAWKKRCDQLLCGDFDVTASLLEQKKEAAKKKAKK